MAEFIPEVSVKQVTDAPDELAIVKAGHGSQVIKVLEDHSYQLDERELEEVLMKKHIRNLPIVVVSVAGAYRGGKSFLLNFFLRYLTSSPSARADGSWLGEDSQPLTGFSWRGGSTRNTTGILMWSEPVVITRPSGEKVAVLVMDTQGTFDNESTVRDCSTIFALSTLLSSVQIYNLSINIKEDDMQHLQLFTEYGKLARSESMHKPFQVLEFLVRDWQFFWEFPYGEEGGNALLQKKLEVTSKTPEEMKELRKQLLSSFEKVSAFLMPHPGFRVLHPDFKGHINELDPTFRVHVIKLVELLFSPEKLMPKTINGEQIKARDLFTYFKTYMDLFNSDEVPQPTNIMQATVMAGLLTAMNEARELYDAGMDNECGPEQPSMPVADLQELHRKYMATARVAFLSRKKMGSLENANKYLEEVIKELDARLSQFEQNNLAKLELTVKKSRDAYEDAIQKASKGNPLCLHPLDLKKVHQEGVKIAVKLFNANRKIITSSRDDEKSKFEQSLEKLYEKFALSNEVNNKTVVTELRSNYSKLMESKCSLEPPLREGDFKHEHENALKIVLKAFDDKRNFSNSYPEDVYKQNLLTEINTIFDQLNIMNTSKYNAMAQSVIRNAINKARQLYENKMLLECGTGKPSMPVSDVETLHRKYLELAKATFMTNMTMGTKEEAEIEIKALTKEFEERLPQYHHINQSKLQATIKKSEDVYEEIIYNISMDQPLCLHPLDLKKDHEKGVDAAMKLFDAHRKTISSKTDSERSNFKQSFEKRYEKLQKTNELNNKTMVTEIRSKYSKFMESKCSLEPPLHDDEFRQEHEKEMKQALEDFESKRNRLNSYPEDVYKQYLIMEITNIFKQLNKMNTSKYKVTAQSAIRHAMNEARQLYEKEMQLECGPAQPSMPANAIDDLHRKNFDSAKATFIANVNMSTKDEAEIYLQELARELEGRLVQYQQNNKAKFHTTIKIAEDAYEEMIRNIHGDQPLNLHPSDLLKVHQEAVEASLKLFDSNRKIISNKTDEERSQFEQSFKKRYERLQVTNEVNNKTVITELRAIYSKYMEVKCTLEPPLTEDEFKREHELKLKIVLEDFDSKRNRSNSYPDDVHRKILIMEINTIYDQLNKMNLSKYKSTTKEAIRHAITEANELYEKKMQLECGPTQPSMPASDVETLHRKCLDAAKATFAANITMDTKEKANKYLEKLIKELDARLILYQQINMSKFQTTVKYAEDAYEETIQNISKGQSLCLHPIDLEKCHQEGVTAAMKIFNKNRKTISSKVDDEKIKFEKSFQKRYVKMQLSNEKNNKMIVKEIHTEYWKFMETKCALTPPLSDADFKIEHERALKDALSEFDSKRNRPDSYPKDVFKNDLEKKIWNSFTQFQLINSSHRIEQEVFKAEQEKTKEYQEKLKEEQERNKMEQEKFREAQEKYKIEQEKLRQDQEKRVIEYEKKIREQAELDKKEREERERELAEKELEERGIERQEREKIMKSFEDTLKAEQEKNREIQMSLIGQHNEYKEEQEKKRLEELEARTRYLEDMIARQDNDDDDDCSIV